MSGVVASSIASIPTKVRQLSRLSQKLFYVESAPYLSHGSPLLHVIQFDFNFWRLSERIRQKFLFLRRGAEDPGKIFHDGKYAFSTARVTHALDPLANLWIFPTEYVFGYPRRSAGGFGEQENKGKYRREHGKDPVLGNTETTKPI